MKKLISFIIVLSFIAITLSSCASNSTAMKIKVSGDKTENLEFDSIYCSYMPKANKSNDIMIRFSNSKSTSGFPSLQINIRKANNFIGTFLGGNSGTTADIQLNFTAPNYFTTYNTENFMVKINNFDDKKGLSGDYEIKDNGKLSSFDNKSTVILEPAIFSFKCNCVDNINDFEQNCPVEKI